AIEDGVALATILAASDKRSAPQALRVYERVRRERTARVQRSSRANGARYDAATADLSARDYQLSNQARDRAWMWDCDAQADAIAALATRP
ncbi:MAG TPA: 2-polyprenyl-6-methoxyphenol hydroxylase, partial [Chloroflexota bacterium]|nr:2-polyprenyl-6-methoxyphenol hydroxylase [Chloroflexota bacterium]